jgi:hypothetical protein
MTKAVTDNKLMRINANERRRRRRKKNYSETPDFPMTNEKDKI